MSKYIGRDLAAEVIERAKNRCEYCLIAAEDTYFGIEIDHIRSRKHNGTTESANLALACQPCNRNKGSDLGSVFDPTNELIRFFNPRNETWSDHFRVDSSGKIIALTPTAEVTLIIFRFNDPERTIERMSLIELGRYPY